MRFLIQKDECKIDLDNQIVKDYISKSYVHTYSEITLQEFIKTKSEYNNCIPIGTLEFVGEHLKKYHGIKNMNPIEVPEVLRKPEFLHRNYDIVEKEKLPKSGNYFVKYVSKLKDFSFSGKVESLYAQHKLKEGLYAVSELVDIVSEYRCFVSEDYLVAVNNYEGNPYSFPNPSVVNSMIIQYMRDETRPKSYTMDIAVLKNGDTCILEVHPWICVGLYGYLFDKNLPYCYVDGYNYYVKVNKPLDEWLG